MKPRNTYNHTYIKFSAWTKQNNLTLNPDKTTCTVFYSRPCRIQEQSRPKNEQHCTTHGNAPKASGPYLRPKTHIQHTHSQHQYKHTRHYKWYKHSLQQDGMNRMRHSWLPIRQSWDRLWSMHIPYSRFFHTRPALTNCKSCRMQHWELPQDVHTIQTYNICRAKHSHVPNMIIYSPMRHNTNRQHNIHHTLYTNIQHTSTLQG